LPSSWKRIASRKTPLHALIVCISVLLICAGCSEKISDRRVYVLTTGNTGGTYYPVGVALSTVVTAIPDAEFSLTAISSAGSMENIKLLRDNQAQFGLILSIFAAWAWEGEGPIRNPQKNLRSISAMWPNVEHFVLSSNFVTTGTLSDLANITGQRYVLGMRNSGAEHTGIYILNSIGIDYNNAFNTAYMGYGASAGALQDGNIVGMNVPAGAPVTAITQAYAQLGPAMTILDFSEDDLARVNSQFPLWDFYTMPPGTYPYQDSPIRTASSPNVLVVRDDVSDDVVYQLTKLLWENLSTLQEIHSATKQMNLADSLKGIPVPLHKGALRYYQERGISIPNHLLGG
jgi:TRAP transporter TAXI family solute receptor